MAASTKTPRERMLNKLRIALTKDLAAGPPTRELAALSRELRYVMQELEALASPEEDDLSALMHKMKEGNGQPETNPPSTPPI